jgi:peroxiredoxin/outer membrane protein assembly factor BamD (BamD/ComL family)
MLRVVGMLVLVCIGTLVPAQDKSEGPSNEKAQKSFKEAQDYLRRHMIGPALDAFKKADKQDDGHCRPCQEKMIRYGIELGEWKIAETAAEEMIAQAQGDKNLAIAHYQLGIVFYFQGIRKNKDEFFARSHEELTKALATAANFPDALFSDGQALAHMGQYDQAKERFAAFAKMRPADDPDRQRALRDVEQPELARARMAPAFAVTLVDGQRLALDDLKGKVVLIDFWATWCAPCREAVPHIRELTRKFQGEPFVVLSVSLDEDEQKWKDFISKNEMTWHQCRDGGFKGPVAQMFGVNAIPNTFTIDADGVLQYQHIGDASIEGKLKKLVKRAREIQEAPKPAPPPTQVAN